MFTTGIIPTITMTNTYPSMVAASDLSLSDDDMGLELAEPEAAVDINLYPNLYPNFPTRSIFFSTVTSFSANQEGSPYIFRLISYAPGLCRTMSIYNSGEPDKPDSRFRHEVCLREITDTTEFGWHIRYRYFWLRLCSYKFINSRHSV